jgi:hypothetical protein
LKSKAFALSLVVVLLTSIFFTISLGNAVTSGEWITSYQITDKETGRLLAEYDSATDTNNTLAAVIPGAEISITFTVNVLVAGEGNLRLTSGLSKPSSGAYWEFVSDDYDLGSSFSPNSASTQFNWVEGIFEITLNGRVPNTNSVSKPIDAVSLFGPSGGTALAKITVRATSADMDQFLTLYDQAEEQLRSYRASGVDTGFCDAYQSSLTVSEDIATNGDVTSAITLLNGWLSAAAPAGSVMQILFIPLIAVAVALAVIFAILFMRTRGKVGYFRLVVEDQIKDLSVLSLRAAKVDRAMSASLESVKEKLQRLVGL